MKPLSIVLFIASLGLNAALGFFLVRPPAASTGEVESTSALRALPAKNESLDPKIWDGLKTDDLPALLARLRDSGFPPDVIRAILTGQLNDQFAARRKALGLEGANGQAYWKNRRTDPKTQSALRDLSREQDKALRTLLGDDAASSNPLNAALQSRQLRGVPPEKANDVQKVIQAYDEKRSDIYSKGNVLPADREKINALDKEQRAAIAQVLTPAEFESYQLYNSNTASQLRSQLSAFHADEAEFRTIFALQNTFNEQFPNNFTGGVVFAGDQPEREAAQKAMTEQIKAALGPDRAADYTRALDYNYRQTDQLVSRLQLPPDTTNQIWGVQQDLQQRSQAIFSDRFLPPDQRTQQLAALADEAKTRISASLGESGFEAYKQYGGQWMQRFQPPVVRPAR